MAASEEHMLLKLTINVNNDTKIGTVGAKKK